MIIKVNAGEITIDVSVGDGRQTFKWLAGVVQQRITQYHMRRKRFETENYIVTELKNTSGELLNPTDLIYEHGHAEGFTIGATLVSNYPVDEWDNPDMGDWMRRYVERYGAILIFYTIHDDYCIAFVQCLLDTAPM